MFCFFFFKQKTAYERRISDWSSDVCSSDLVLARPCECTRSGIEQRLELRSIAQECCTGRFHAGLSLAQSRQRRFDICLRRDSLLGAALDRCEQPVERSNVVIPLDHLILSLEDIEICLQGALTQR